MGEGGTPLLKEQIIPTLLEKEEVLTSFLSAVRGLADEVIGGNLKHLEAEKGDLYMDKVNDLTIMLISDKKDDSLVRLISDLGESLINEEITASSLQVDSDIRDKAKKICKKHILRRAPSLDPIREVIDTISSVPIVEKGKELDPEALQPQKLGKPSILSSFFGETPSLDTLVNDYFKGRWKQVCKKAPKKFNGSQSDLARMLYVRAGLNLNTMPPNVNAPSIRDLSDAVSEIDDNIAKKYLHKEIKAHTKQGAYSEPHLFFNDHYEEILERIQEDTIAADIFASIFWHCTKEDMCKRFMEKFEGKSELLKVQYSINKIYYRSTTKPPKNVEAWKKTFSTCYQKLQQSDKRDSRLTPYYLYLAMHHLLRGFLIEDLGKEEGLSLMKKFQKLEMNYRDRFKEMEVETRVKSSYFSMIATFLPLLLEFKDPMEAREMAIKYYQAAKTHVELLQTLREADRIAPDLYDLSFTKVLSTNARLLSENEKYINNIPEIVNDLTKEELCSLWQHDRHRFAHYYIGLLSILGNTAISYLNERLQREVCWKIGVQIEKMVKFIDPLPLNYWTFMFQALRFYKKSNSKKGEKKVKQIVKELEKEASPFFSWILDQKV